MPTSRRHSHASLRLGGLRRRTSFASVVLQASPQAAQSLQAARIKAMAFKWRHAATRTRDSDAETRLVGMLREVPIFDGLPPRTFDTMVTLVDLVDLNEAYTDVVSVGQEPSHLYILVEGAVDVPRVCGFEPGLAEGSRFIC